MKKTSSRLTIDDLEAEGAKLMECIRKADLMWREEEEIKQSREIASKLSLNDLVSECVRLLKFKTDLAKQWDVVYDRHLPFVQHNTHSKSPCWDETSRASKRFFENCPLRRHALKVWIFNIRKQGREALKAEIQALTNEALETESQLLQECRAAIREKLIPLEAEWLVTAESLSDGAMPLEAEDRRLLQVEIDRRRREVNPEETIAGRLNAVRARLDSLMGRNYLTFNQMVDCRLETEEDEKCGT